MLKLMQAQLHQITGGVFFKKTNAQAPHGDSVTANQW